MAFNVTNQYIIKLMPLTIIQLLIMKTLVAPMIL
jgi:hypothetical protein